mgnify:CR=1 FL=1
MDVRAEAHKMKLASPHMAVMTLEQRNAALKSIVDALADKKDDIFRENEADVVLGSNGEMDISYPVMLANTASLFSDGPVTYDNGTAHLKGTYDKKTHVFTGTATSDLPDLLYNNSPITLTFDLDSKPIKASGEMSIHSEFMDYSFDDTAEVAMTKK